MKQMIASQLFRTLGRFGKLCAHFNHLCVFVRFFFLWSWLVISSPAAFSFLFEVKINWNVTSSAQISFKHTFFLSRLVYDLKEPLALRYDMAITNAGWTEVNRTKKFGELKKKNRQKNKVQKQQTIYRPVSFSNAYHHLASG